MYKKKNKKYTFINNQRNLEMILICKENEIKQQMEMLRKKLILTFEYV